jgi:hypothetical protein
MSNLLSVLLKRLDKKGIAPDDINLFLQDIYNSLIFHPCITLTQMNQRLELLGWTGLHLDDHTLQLVIATDYKRSSIGLKDEVTFGLNHPN